MTTIGWKALCEEERPRETVSRLVRQAGFMYNKGTHHAYAQAASYLEDGARASMSYSQMVEGAGVSDDQFARLMNRILGGQGHALEMRLQDTGWRGVFTPKPMDLAAFLYYHGRAPKRVHAAAA